MKEKITNHSKWLENNPEFEGDNKEVFENADGSQYIPVYFIECLLDKLTDTNWSTEKFMYGTSTRVLNPNEEVGYICGKIELTVTYGNITRTITGVCDIKVDDLIAKTVHDKDNDSYQATALSYCLCNAAKKLGNRFGRSLNGRGVGKVQEGGNELPKIKADKSITKQYKDAVESGDMDTAKKLLDVYEIKISK